MIIIIILILIIVKLTKLESFYISKKYYDESYYSIKKKIFKLSFIENKILLNYLFNINTINHEKLNKDIYLYDYLKNIKFIKKYNINLIIKELNIFLKKKYSSNLEINNNILFIDYKNNFNKIIKNYLKKLILKEKIDFSDNILEYILDIIIKDYSFQKNNIKDYIIKLLIKKNLVDYKNDYEDLNLLFYIINLIICNEINKNFDKNYQYVMNLDKNYLRNLFFTGNGNIEYYF